MEGLKESIIKEEIKGEYDECEKSESITN